MQHRSRSGSAFFWGIIFGLILAVLIVLDRLVSAALVRRGIRGGLGFGLGGVLASGAFAVVVTCTLYFLAGVRAARRARALEAGLLAGTIAGAVAGITRLMVAVLTLGALRSLPPAAPAHLRIGHLLNVGTVAGGVLALVVDILIGTGLGALGGLVGRGQRSCRSSGGASADVPALSARPARCRLSSASVPCTRRVHARTGRAARQRPWE